MRRLHHAQIRGKLISRFTLPVTARPRPSPERRLPCSQQEAMAARMAKVTFIFPAGGRRELDAPLGASIMMTAVVNGIDEILAECGGSVACATCHVYVEPSQLPLLPPMSAAEDELLNAIASERRPNSRLSCQLIVTEALDGLVVQLPLVRA
jgi:ferredoxin, 2Fe-2S